MDGECRRNVGAGGVESEPPGTGLAQGMSDSPQICQEVKGLGAGHGSQRGGASIPEQGYPGIFLSPRVTWPP